MDIHTLTVIHTALSLIALVLGVPALMRLFGIKTPCILTKGFLVTAVLTTVTGFFFPFNGVTPAFGTGIFAALIFLAMALVRKCKKVWAGGMVASEFLLVFVTIAQSFQKIPFLQAFAPTGKEPPFAIAELAALAIFVLIGYKAVKASQSVDGCCGCKNNPQ